MKKIFNTTMAFVAAVSILSLAGCQKASKEDINPTYDGEAVKTQFSIAMPSQLKAKMTAGTVQASGDISDFRGMSNISLIPYTLNNTDIVRLGDDNVTLLARTLAAPSATNAQNSIPNGQLLAGNNAVLYNDVTIPIGTSHFLFYGEATGTDGYADGSLVEANMTATDPTTITFTPEPIVASVTTGKGEDIATYVTAIAAAGATATLYANVDEYNSAKGTSLTAADFAALSDAEKTIPALLWANCADADTYGPTGTNPHPWYNAALGKLYTDFTSMKAGASAYVQAAVQDLYSSVFNSANPIAAAIRTAIKTTYASDADNTGTLTFANDINGYPGNDNNYMPDGTAFLTWSGTPLAATAVTSGNIGIGGDAVPTMALNMATIVYPASLWYFVDSDIKTANASQAANYVANKAWSGDNSILAGYSGTSVTNTTRSVAITKPIQYAVGRLDVSVAELSATNYYDRNGQVVNKSNGFTLNGVLIGGQKPVDYNFDQITTGTEYTIYDKTINTASLTTSTAAANYTLALATTDDDPVYVALEFINNSGADFQGYDGVVKAGCKFYMIAKLDPTATGVGNYGAGAGQVKQVFKQDYVTQATFTIGAGKADSNHDGKLDANDTGEGTVGGFANAYVTIPDLRTPQLELGFSVNLTWQSGLTFNHTF